MRRTRPRPRPRRFPDRADREAACTRVSSRWRDDIIRDAKMLILHSRWDLRHLDDSPNVGAVQAFILRGGQNPNEALVAIVAAVMAWTGGELPDSWTYALRHLPGPDELRLRAFFSGFARPERDPF
ncbi:31b4cd86-8042-4f58-9003-86fbf9f62c01 [Thermothielavioides terrestris]|uniref:31b4cd86-8042-4f58-9003-86fbf9f62c01 n=1 Tax=Thermothielavioides terrestris TaxID=2587410 RepID=A0A446BAP1_9PEZI|nr:31b4cd86-8042-4f58-9003-86fbf9f62c01 [Thermothielavioides terrestris]